jgi:hypothetical protein
MSPNRAQRITFGTEIAPDLRLGAVRLEHCCDQAGKLLPWALQILALLLSPDGDTLRLPILYRFSDLAEIPTSGPVGDGFYFPRGGAAIELQLRGSGAPPDHLSVEQLLGIVQKLGPAFAAGESAGTGAASGPDPTALVDALLLDRVLKSVASGCPAACGAPWSPLLRDKQPRSIRTLFRQHGVTNVRADLGLLRVLSGRGVVVADYRRAKGDYRKGLRTIDGLPAAIWAE